VPSASTKAKNPFFHVQVRLPEGEQITSEQWQQTTDRTLKRLELTGQPYAAVFHLDERTGERHLHLGISLIDAEAMKAKPVPFFKSRLKALARELEEEFDITRVKNEREGPIQYAATKNEQQQAQRLGVDKEALRNTIRACWDRSDCGRGFDDELAHEGLILAQGNRRDYVVIDHAGGVHALGKRLLDVSAAQVRDKLADLDREHMPTVQQAREFMLDLPRDRAERLTRELAETQKQLEAEQEYARRDPVREDMAWQDAVAKAAIEKEKIERHFVEPQPEKETRRGRQEKEPAQQPEPKPVPVPELGKTQGEIRLARRLSPGPQSFANAIEDRGFILARVTPDDIQKEMARLREKWEERRRNPQIWMEHEGGFVALNPELQASARRSFDEWQKQRDKDEDKRKGKQQEKAYTVEGYVDYVQKKWLEGPKSQLERAIGGLAVITPFESIYTLTPRNTGLDRDELPHYLKAIDRAALLSVTDAQAVMQEVREHHRAEWLARQPLGRMAGEIRLAYSLTQTGQQFADAIEDRGLILAHMTATDAERLNRWERQRLREEWTAPGPEKHGAAGQSKEPEDKYRAGELVVVNQYGQVFQLTQHNTGHDDQARTERLKDIDRPALLSVTEAQGVMKEFQQHRQEERRQAGQQQREDWLRPAREQHWPTKPPQPERNAPGLFQQAATEAARDERTENLQGAAAQVWTAFRESGNEEAFRAVLEKNDLFSVRTGDRKAFAAALEDGGIAFAVATKEEADRSNSKEAAFVRAIGNYVPRFKEGEIVLVTEARFEYRRDGELTVPRRVYKLDQSLAEKFVKTLDNRSQLQGIEATKQKIDTRAQERKAERDSDRMDRATWIQDWAPERGRKTKILEPIVQAGKIGTQVIEAGIDAAANIATAAFSILDPPTTPAQRAQAAAQSRQERETQAEIQIDFSRFTSDQAQQRQNHQEQQAARDRQRESERERF
jgi:hypothetical protein